MKSTLAVDLDRLTKLAYHRKEWCGPLVERYYVQLGKETAHPDAVLLKSIYPWLFVPLSLWAVNLQDLFGRTLSRIEQGESIVGELRFLIEKLPRLPAARVQAIAAQHEWAVQKGEYAVQVKAAAKFDLREKALLENVELQTEWTSIKEAFDVADYQDYKGVIRRTLVSERGFRPGWESAPADADFLFCAAFDVFCLKWDLYGMQYDCPLLQRLTVNLTPNGTMIFIPAWWSLDGKRDLSWKEIQALHSARVTSRQGEKLSENQAAQKKEAEQVYKWNEKARAMGLKGDVRVQWVAGKMKWKGEAARKLSRILARRKQMATQKQSR